MKYTVSTAKFSVDVEANSSRGAAVAGLRIAAETVDALGLVTKVKPARGRSVYFSTMAIAPSAGIEIDAKGR